VGDMSIENNKLVDRILEQKLSFNIVQRMLDDNKLKADGSENKDIIQLINDLQALKTAFDKVKVETTESQAVNQKDIKVTTIKSQTTVSVTPQDFKQIQLVVEFKN
jgi:hypothetical protein